MLSTPGMVCLINQCRSKTERYYGRIQHLLPGIGRTLISLTFLEDSFRIMTGFSNQIDFLQNTRILHVPLPWVVAGFFVLFSFVTQALGSILVVTGVRADLGAYLLGSYIVPAFFMYGFNVPHWVHYHGRELFLIRLVALGGACVMIIADSQLKRSRERNNVGFAGIPSLSDPLEATYKLQLFGRCMIVALALSCWTHGIVIGLLTTIVGAAVALGFRSKLATLLLGTIFTLSMLITHDWSSLGSSSLADAVLYVLCQDLSIIGGLVVLTTAGPGNLSIDNRRKAF